MVKSFADSAAAGQAQVIIDWQSGALSGNYIQRSEKRLRDLQLLFRDHEQAAAMDLETLIYRVEYWLPVVEGTAGGLFWGTTVVSPGRVGDEFFMTHGHLHVQRDRAEFYATLSGTGALILMDESGKTRAGDHAAGQPALYSGLHGTSCRHWEGPDGKRVLTWVSQRPRGGGGSGILELKICHASFWVYGSRVKVPPDQPNYAWCFDCVPEENSLLLGFGERRIEIPALDLVFHRPKEVLGEFVTRCFGAEFPIRFDFLDTMNGGKLSLQVHPLTSYIREHFGVSYTQDESYYLLDAAPDASVFLGLKEGTDRGRMISELRAAQNGEGGFPAENYVNRWPARKHDHFLIPADTIHCSGRNSVVLEISATPYIFTFKLWDWGRLGLDGRFISMTALPISSGTHHGMGPKNLINQIQPVARGEGWCEERTGLHSLEFIETRRHWFTAPVPHETGGSVHVLNLVEGDAAVVESSNGAFDPWVVHYAETFIVPASVGAYTIRPFRSGQRCATTRASVRSAMRSDFGLEVEATFEPLGFRYGPDVQGPEPELRSLDSIRSSLCDPTCGGPRSGLRNCHECLPPARSSGN